MSGHGETTCPNSDCRYTNEPGANYCIRCGSSLTSLDEQASSGERPSGERGRSRAVDIALVVLLLLLVVFVGLRTLGTKVESTMEDVMYIDLENNLPT